MGTLNWVASLALITGIALLVAALVVVLAKASTTPADLPAPESAMRAAQHRATAASDPPEAAYWRSFTDTVPNIRLAAIAEHAADTIADIPTDPERTTP